jgi:integrase
MLTSKKEREFCFTGPLAGVISHFFEDMRLSGRVYNAEGYYLRRLAHDAEEAGLDTNCMTKEFVETWCQKREYESHKTWSNRVIVIRKLADYMDLRGMSVYKPSIVIPVRPSDFTPHIYTTSELKRIFEQADLLPFYPNCPNRGPVASLLFRMLYGCGLRISEALNLTMRDVDLNGGVLTVWNSKFGKNRYVPMSPELTERCRQYVARTRNGVPENAPFFPAPDGGYYSKRAIYSTFRRILENAGIPCTEQGPRIHDFRHTFSVHCLKKWILAGRDMNAALPVLSAYLGHKDLSGTQGYLRLTADMYPDIIRTMELRFGDIVPGGETDEEG